VAKPRESQEPGLAEVERALSILEGRHPEHERVRRETRVAAAERQRALEDERTVQARRRRRRLIVVALNVVAFGAAAVVGSRIFARAHALRERLDRVEAPFAEAGWSEIASNVVSSRPRLDVEVPASSCVIALSTSDEMIRVREGESTVEARGSVGFCTCDSRVEAVVEAPSSSILGATGLSLMRADSRVVGGPLARGWLAPAPAAWGEGGAECADATLDAWLAAGHTPGSPVDDAWLSRQPTRSPLGRAGFHVVGSVPAGHPFGVAATPAGQCVVAVAEGGELLSLRLAGGNRPISRAPGAMVWCAAQATTFTVWREGISPVVAVAAPAEPVGGLLGTRECAAAAGARVVAEATWISDADLAWDAACLLRASSRAGAQAGVAAATLPAEPGAHDARLVALTLAPGARVAWEPGDEAAACDPPLGAATVLRESVCMHGAAVSWWRQGDGMAGVARSSLPFWLAPIEPWREPAAIALVPKLLALARQLGREGFTPSLLEGVTELADGVRVVGRANEDAVVAIGLGQTSPWVFPFTNERAWSLGEAPGLVPLEPGESIKLTASPLPTAPLERRRTVVFRREVRQ
jgi:hypothetical protein